MSTAPSREMEITDDADDVEILAEVTRIVPGPLTPRERGPFFCQAGDDAPSMRCPITCEPFKVPVQAADGFTYEEAAINEWVVRQQVAGRQITSPKTGKPMLPGPYYRNFTLMAVMREIGEVYSRSAGAAAEVPNPDRG